MTPSSKHGYRFFQFVLLFILFGFAIGLYTNWHHIISRVVEWQKVFHGLLATHVNAISQDPVNHGLALIALSFGYGVFHAIGPGHGKAVIITYLGSHKESLRRGAVISLLAALLQSVVAILLVVVLSKILSIRFSEVNNYADDITTVSYLLVMALGVFLFVTALSRQWKQARQNSGEHSYLNDEHSHNHDTHLHKDTHHEEAHHHDHLCCGGHHVHQSNPKESWLKSISVILSMGIRPCAGAIVVLIYAHLVGAFYYGVMATLVMGLGTGLSIASIALGTQLARNWFEKLAKTDDNQYLFHFNAGPWLRMAGGLIIFLLGLSLFQAATQISNTHPLM